MSGKLYWSIAKKTPVPGNELRLRSALMQQYSLADGGVWLKAPDQLFLKALAITGIEGAQELLECLQKHGEIEVTIEY